MLRREVCGGLEGLVERGVREGLVEGHQIHFRLLEMAIFFKFLSWRVGFLELERDRWEKCILVFSRGNNEVLVWSL